MICVLTVWVWCVTVVFHALAMVGDCGDSCVSCMAMVDNCGESCVSSVSVEGDCGDF